MGPGHFESLILSQWLILSVFSISMIWEALRHPRFPAVSLFRFFLFIPILYFLSYPSPDLLIKGVCSILVKSFCSYTGESRRTLLCSSLCSYPTEFVLTALSTSDSSKTEKGWFSWLSFKPRAFGLKKHILGPKKGRCGSLYHGTAEERRCRGSHRVTAEEAERIRMRLLMRVRIFLV